MLKVNVLIIEELLMRFCIPGLLQAAPSLVVVSVHARDVLAARLLLSTDDETACME